MVDLPWPAKEKGREQVGERPALIVQADDTILPTTMVIPFTGKLGALRFAHTIPVEPSEENGLSHSSVMLVFQMRAVDKKRIVRKLGHIEDGYMDQARAAMQELLVLA